MRLTTKGVDPRSISERIIEQVADYKGVDPLDLDAPLNDVIDPDALDSLFPPTTPDAIGRVDHVAFTYEECRVSVETDGTVHVTDASESPP